MFESINKILVFFDNCNLQAFKDTPLTVRTYLL